MKFCKKCNLAHDDDFLFCPKCGSSLATKIETMFCPYCGKKVESDVDFCPYCGKNLNTDILYTHAQSSNVNSQHSDSRQNNNIHFDTNFLPAFNLNNCLNYIRNTPFIKWAVIVLMYFIVVVTYTMTEGAMRTYSMGGGNNGSLSTESFFLSLLVFALIFVATWHIVNKLNPKAAKILKFILVYIVALRVVLKLFGVTFGVMIALIFVLVSAYYSKKTTEK